MVKQLDQGKHNDYRHPPPPLFYFTARNAVGHATATHDSWGGDLLSTWRAFTAPCEC